MNGSVDFYKAIQKETKIHKDKDTKIILCPPFIYLPFLKVNNKNVFLGAQDIAGRESVKGTGKISGKMLKEFNVSYCIVGHCELKDDDEMIVCKIKKALKNKIIPIICVGENNEKDDVTVIQEKLNKYLAEISREEIIIAYEPCWSVGSGKTPKIERINAVSDIIKSFCESKRINVKILYGGSVNKSNFSRLKKANIDGFLIGEQSKDLISFVNFIKE
jgi:triosephosphate isomerase